MHAASNPIAVARTKHMKPDDYAGPPARGSIVNSAARFDPDRKDHQRQRDADGKLVREVHAYLAPNGDGQENAGHLIAKLPDHAATRVRLCS